MKKFLFVIILTISLSCSNDSDNDLPLTIAPSTVEDIMTKGTWRITLYMDDNKNETSDYTGYSFTFNANKSVTALKNAQTTTGNWSSFNDSGKVKFLINFGDIFPLDEISDDWDVKLLTSQKIELEDISGGDGTIDKLTFQKN